MPYKTCCNFIQYMANKSDKFVLKIWHAVKLETNYFFNGFMYLEKYEDRNICLHYVVMNLIDRFLCKGKNVTMDNFSPSQELANTLLAKRITIVGTILLN